MKLVVAEKAIAAERIAKILGNAKKEIENKIPVFVLPDTIVVPLRGHIVNVDFPDEYKNWVGTALPLLVESEILYKTSAPGIKRTLETNAKQCDTVIIATDYDREGESIGKEALEIIRKVNPKIKVKRAKFSALTDSEVKKAFNNLADFNENLADSADARREIDLVWGAVLTRFLSIAAKRLGNSFLSVGRVQTPTLALTVDREKEIRAFKPEDYWALSIDCEKNKEKFTATYEEEKIFDQKKAEKLSKLKGDTATVTKVQKKQVSEAPPTPFSTTDFLRAAANLGVQPGEAMSIAESLYINGFISYPRTDNTCYPDSLDLKEILIILSKSPEFGTLADKILKKKKLTPTRGKKQTTDHPPIHPVELAPKSRLKPKEWKVYELVVRRFLATLADPAILDTVRADLKYSGENFIAFGKTIKEKGWKEFYIYSKIEDITLPELVEKEIVKVLKLNCEKKQTKPKNRYTPASLIKLMEQLGLGTKCFTGNTKIKILNGHNEKHVSFGDLFEKVSDAKNVYSCISAEKNKVLCPPLSCVTKRLLKPTEQIYEILFSDGTRVNSTSDHQFYVYSDPSYQYVEAKNFDSNVKVVCAQHPDKVDKELISWDNFLASCDKSINIFAPLKLEKGKFTQDRLAKKLGTSQGNINCYIHGKRDLPLWIIKKLKLRPEIIVGVNKNLRIKNPFPMYECSSLFRLIANFCGDGSIDFTKLKKENCVDFRYSNTNLDLLNRFADDINFIFGFRPKIKQDKRYIPNRKTGYYIQVPSLIGRILLPFLLNPFKYIPKEFYSEFIGAFFDDEGHAYKNEKKIFISNTNHEYLRNLKEMLDYLGIYSVLDVKQHKLYIRREKSIQRFLEKIPIASVSKKQRIIDMLSYKFTPQATRSSRSIAYQKKRILNLLSLRDYTTLEICKELGLSAPTTTKYLKELIKEGFVSRKILSKNHTKDRNVIYYLERNYMGTFYSLLEEKVLAPNVTTLTVLNSEPIKSNEKYVYDLTVNPLTPNFALENGVVVHNSTRAEIIQKLIDRGYITGSKNFTPSEIAFATIYTLEKHAEKITKPKMTSDLEKEMDQIEEGKLKMNNVVTDSRKLLSDVLQQLAQHNSEIVKGLQGAVSDEQVIGKCPKCGKDLRIIKTRRGTRFVGCSGYMSGCNVSFPLPAQGMITDMHRECEVCKMPVIRVVNGPKHYEMCINHLCESKKNWSKPKKPTKAKK